ncbi:hypothetical protein L323_20175 [Ruminiclostridium papyrosolvens C7]|uniref:Uncharacterized protein n=1 Tax=Ruminiclostridium papyrosolvens C7 TaxID=1330534 RepID=U4QXT2_9FIRM|nr:hypothetical protein L323_20175 [Ruminiclostridium papyrosolvens C7]
MCLSEHIHPVFLFSDFPYFLDKIKLVANNNFIGIDPSLRRI